MTNFRPFRGHSVATAALAGLVLQLGSAAVLADTATSSENPVYAPLVLGHSARALPQEKVAIGDLDLSSDAGMAALKDRITAAAKVACERADAINLHSLANESRCRMAAIDGAMAQVDARKAGTRVASR